VLKCVGFMKYRILLALFPILGLLWLSPGGSGGPKQRHLFICLDGVGHAEFAALQREGYFTYMTSVSKLIVPFPSLTNAAFVQILRPAGSPTSPGYEDRYYSRETGRMVGGILNRFRDAWVKGTFRELFTYHPSGFESSLEYVLPPHSAVRMASHEFRSGLDEFRATSHPLYMLYLGPTDATAHTGGTDALLPLLHSFDWELRDLLQRYPETEVSILSDHGNEYAEYRRVDIVEALKKEGYQERDKLTSDDSVVVPLYGLIGAAVVFTKPGNEPAVAEVLSRVEGVHFACYKEGSVVRLYRNGHQASIEKRGSMFHYSPGEADPLELGVQPPRTAEQWYMETRDTEYPDSVNRVWNQSDDAIENRASVIVSFQKGYYTGSRFLDLFATLKGTHGNLNRAQSLAFAASTHRELPEYTTTQGIWHELGLGSLSTRLH
jgi:hypothetical protein